MQVRVLLEKKKLSVLADRLSVMGSPDPHLATMYKQWAARYKAFSQRRFVRLSRGGGEWAPIKARARDIAAYQAKRKLKNKPKKWKILKKISAILRDTSTLFTVLDPSTLRPGAIQEIRLGVLTVGYGGGDPHPSTKGRVTIAQIAEFHQVGAGNLPIRRIIVAPDSATVAGMAADATRAANSIIKEVAQMAALAEIVVV